jgi:hypothetical protein
MYEEPGMKTNACVCHVCMCAMNETLAAPAMYSFVHVLEPKEREQMCDRECARMNNQE